MLQHVIAVVAAEAVQGLLRGELLQLGKGKNLARAVVLTGGVVEFAVAESGGRKVVMRVNHGDSVSKIHTFRRGGEGVQEVFHGRGTVNTKAVIIPPPFQAFARHS